MPLNVVRIILPGEKKRLKEPEIDAIETPAPRPYAGGSFRLIIVGPSGSGKTTLFVFLLTQVYMKIFTHVYIFNPTLSNDSTVRGLIAKDEKTGLSFIDEEDVFEMSDKTEITDKVEQLIHELDVEIKDTPNDEVPPKTLMVFDDLTQEMHDSTIMKNLFTKGRKHELSLIVMSNKYKVYSPDVRANATHYAFFKPETTTEEDSIIADLTSLGYSKETLRAVMNKVFSIPGGFLFVDKRAEHGKRLWFRMEKPIKVSS